MKIRSLRMALQVLSFLFTILLAGCRAQSVKAVQFSPTRPGTLCVSQKLCGADVPLQAYHGCTVFYAADDTAALGGNSEDYGNPLAYAWIEPAEAGKFARFYVGFDNHIAQGGMNDQGLFFDGLGGLTPTEIDTEGKRFFNGVLADRIMAECADVACVEEMFAQYYSAEVWAHQFLFGDRFGDSIIVEPNLVVHKDGAYQVATNFRQSSTPPEQRTCWRFLAAVDLFETAAVYDVSLFEQILDAVHVENTTIYATIYDLKQTRVYLYYFHDYEHGVIFDLKEEASKGSQSFLIESLFPRNPLAEEWKEPILARYHGLVDQRLDESISTDTFSDYQGQYVLPPDTWGENMLFDVWMDAEQLMLQWPHGPRHTLFPQGQDSFFQIAYLGEQFDLQYEIAFQRDEAGDVVRAVIDYAGEEIRCLKLGASPAPAAPTILPTVPPTELPTESPGPELMNTPVLSEPPLIEDGENGMWWILPVVLGLIFGATLGVIWRRR